MQSHNQKEPSGGRVILSSGGSSDEKSKVMMRFKINTELLPPSVAGDADWRVFDTPRQSYPD